MVDTVCVTGNRTGKFPWRCDSAEAVFYLASIKERIREAVEREGYTKFIAGGAIGADMDFSEAVLELKKEYSAITLEIAVPCSNQNKAYNERDKIRYNQILKNADKITQISSFYYNGCMQKRNMYMVDNADLVLGFWNYEKSGGTYNTLKYAKQKEKLVCLYNLNTSTWEEPQSKQLEIPTL